MYGQMLRLPDGGVNFKCSAGRTVGVTDINIAWNAPGVKGREGKIWGTDVAHYDFTVLGFGSNAPSPWRAGANECTTMSFSNDVTINGRKLKAGSYAFFIAVYADSCILIFNSNNKAWGSYFYNADNDVLRVSTKQIKDLPSKERLEYTFSNQSDHTVEIALEWEKWRIPFTVATDLKATTLASIRQQMSGGMGFDPPSLQAAAAWCLNNETNYAEAYNWITSATDPNLGGVNSFNALSVKSGILAKMGKSQEATSTMETAIENASSIELHTYGRSLLSKNQLKEAMAIFEKNFIKNKGAWPTNVGMMRAHAANGDYKKALEFAKAALAQAPDPVNKTNLENSIKKLESGVGL